MEENEGEAITNLLC